MTYILGVNCTDGVVLIGDRKIIYNDTVDWQQKIFGLPVEGQKLMDDASSILKNYVKFNVRTFMEELRGKVTKYYKLHRSSFQPWDFSALIVLQTSDPKGVYLKYIYGTEGAAEDIPRYKIIGSDYAGARTSILLEPIYRHMDMQKAVEFGHFIIALIQKYNFDPTIGGEPDIWRIPKEGHVQQIEEPILTELESKTQQRLNKYEHDLRELFT